MKQRRTACNKLGHKITSCDDGRHCRDCGVEVVIGTRCPPCAVKSLNGGETPRAAGLVHVEKQAPWKWDTDHGPACVCMRCVLARGERRAA